VRDVRAGLIVPDPSVAMVPEGWAEAVNLQAKESENTRELGAAAEEISAAAAWVRKKKEDATEFQKAYLYILVRVAELAGANPGAGGDQKSEEVRSSPRGDSIPKRDLYQARRAVWHRSTPAHEGKRAHGASYADEAREGIAGIGGSPILTLKGLINYTVTRYHANLPRADHRQVQILCGDAVALLREWAPAAHCVVMDPPYGLTTHRTRIGGQDYADGEDYALPLLRNICEILTACLDPSAHIYVFSGYTYAYTFKQLLSEYFDVQDNPIIWVKDNHTMCDFQRWYANRHEYVWFAKRRGSSRLLAPGEVSDVFTVARSNETTHSAEKPVALLEQFIQRSTLPGELVLDPFVGSGATAVASASHGRRFFGTDVDEHWVEVANGRVARIL